MAERPALPCADCRHVTISADEDMETGFMLADEHAPTDPEERVQVFARLAAAEWGTHYDPAEVAQGAGPQPRLYTSDPDNEEAVHPTEPGEVANAGIWWTFDLPDELDPCILCGQHLGHDLYCDRWPNG